LITLRPPTRADARALADAVRDPLADLTPWMTWAIEDYEESDALRFIERVRVDRGEERAHEFLVVGPAGELLGVCGLNRIDAPNRTANLGYWIRSSAAGQGIAPRAVRMLADWAFANTDLARLEILAAVENQRSIRVAEKAGAVREGVLESRLWLHDTPHAAALLSIVKDFRPRARIGF
jgi:ribosomal-protein-serine acetyltransferase